jgi:hypothetical protein
MQLQKIIQICLIIEIWIITSALYNFDFINTRSSTDLLINQLLYNYFAISNMFRPQLFCHHQGECFP